MCEEDKLFNFMFGLQGWAQAELKRQGKNGEFKLSKKNGGKPNKNPESSLARVEKKANSSLATRPTGCFVCNKLHRARDCPKKDEINAFIIVDEDNNGYGWVVALVDNGTTHNFVSMLEATKLSLKLGNWKGTINFLSVSLYDFDFILGNDFFHKTKRGFNLQVEKGLRKGQLTYVVALIEIKPKKMVEVSDEIVPILQEYVDVMPLKVLKKLPPRKPNDHQIKLVSGIKPLVVDPTFKGTIWGIDSLPKKQDVTLQMCVDYRALNKVTIKNKYLILLVADLFDRLTKAEYFTKLDLGSGYWQVRIVEGDESKTTILMNDVLFDFLNSFVVVYLDDIVIYSQTLQDHLVHLGKEGHSVAFESWNLDVAEQRMGKHNQVVDALSYKEVTEFMGSLSQVVVDFTTRVRQEVPQNSTYNKLVEQVKEGTTRRYWFDDGLLYYMDKTEQKKEVGLSHPLLIPERPWQCLSKDFITGFPKV
ncbi:RNA-directed DNA polymerase-like [Vitis vinifera]|uniref:RNA-directed DNA polymerase-like n=1 Tax=Vitis vinifera TaxID=29760 RepID=A0A438GZ84_VITVI|nr:RNA-directed DNA polymerase-like [Vitis vinifera]